MAVHDRGFRTSAVLGWRTRPDILGEAQRISVGVLDEKLPLTAFTIPRWIPRFVRCPEQGPVCRFEGFEDGGQCPDRHL